MGQITNFHHSDIFVTFWCIIQINSPPSKFTSILSFKKDNPNFYCWTITTKQQGISTNVYHDIPRLGSSDGASHLENHASQQPEQSSDAVLSLVVGRNTDVYMAHGRVGVTKSNHGDVSKSCLHDGLHQNIKFSTQTETKFPYQCHSLPVHKILRALAFLHSKQRAANHNNYKQDNREHP